MKYTFTIIFVLILTTSSLYGEFFHPSVETSHQTNSVYYFSNEYLYKKNISTNQIIKTDISELGLEARGIETYSSNTSFKSSPDKNLIGINNYEYIIIYDANDLSIVTRINLLDISQADHSTFKSLNYNFWQFFSEDEIIFLDECAHCQIEGKYHIYNFKTETTVKTFNYLGRIFNRNDSYAGKSVEVNQKKQIYRTTNKDNNTIYYDLINNQEVDYEGKIIIYENTEKNIIIEYDLGFKLFVEGEQTHSFDFAMFPIYDISFDPKSNTLALLNSRKSIVFNIDGKNTTYKEYDFNYSNDKWQPQHPFAEIDFLGDYLYFSRSINYRCGMPIEMDKFSEIIQIDYNSEINEAIQLAGSTNIGLENVKFDEDKKYSAPKTHLTKVINNKTKDTLLSIFGVNAYDVSQNYLYANINDSILKIDIDSKEIVERKEVLDSISNIFAFDDFAFYQNTQNEIYRFSESKTTKIRTDNSLNDNMKIIKIKRYIDNYLIVKNYDVSDRKIYLDYISGDSLLSREVTFDENYNEVNAISKDGNKYILDNYFFVDIIKKYTSVLDSSVIAWYAIQPVDISGNIAFMTRKSYWPEPITFNDAPFSLLSIDHTSSEIICETNSDGGYNFIAFDDINGNLYGNDCGGGGQTFATVCPEYWNYQSVENYKNDQSNTDYYVYDLMGNYFGHYKNTSEIYGNLSQGFYILKSQSDIKKVYITK